MLKRRGRAWELYPYRVKGLRYGEGFEQWALPDKEWWEHTEKSHSFLELSGFEEIKVTPDMEKRFEEIKDMPEDFHGLYIDYVMTGSMSDGLNLPKDHPFNIVRLQKQDEVQGQDIVDRQLEAMEQGQKLSDIELKLLELGV